MPGVEVPRVCLLDTGVNRSHILIEPALAANDLMTVNSDYVATDNIATATAPKWRALRFTAISSRGYKTVRSRDSAIGWNPSGSCPQTASIQMSPRVTGPLRLAPLRSLKSRIPTVTGFLHGRHE